MGHHTMNQPGQNILLRSREPRRRAALSVLSGQIDQEAEGEDFVFHSALE